MTKANREAAVTEELRKAERAFTAYSLLASGGLWEDAVSRLHYFLFHRVRALLLTEGLEPRSHEGALHLLSLHFVRPGHLDSQASQLFAKVMKYREEADYSSSFMFTESDVTRLRDEVTALATKILDLISSAGFKV